MEKSTAMIRKLTRHSFEEFKNFLNKTFSDENAGKAYDFDEQINELLCDLSNNQELPGSYHPGSAEEGGGQQPESGAFFYLYSKASESKREFDPVISSFIALPKRAAKEGGSAKIKYWFYKKNQLNADLSDDNLRDYYAVLEKFAASHGCSEIIIEVTHLTMHTTYLANHGYQIESHGFKDHHLHIELRKPLFPLYSGDTRDWLSLTKWYCETVFPEIKNLQSEQEEGVISYQFEHPLIEGFKYSEKIDINVSLVPKGRKLPKNLSDKKGQIYLFWEDGENIHSTLEEQDIISYNDTQLTTLSGLTKGFHTNHSCWDEYERLKITEKKNGRMLDRDAIIVEIDLQSYADLITERLNSKSRNRWVSICDRELVFFNEPHFGSKLQSGDILFFYVWDAYESEDRNSEAGVLCAYGIISEIEATTVTKATEKWNEKYGGSKHKAIWKDNFLPQYFESKIVAITLNSIHYILPNCGAPNQTSRRMNSLYAFSSKNGNNDEGTPNPIPGISYHDLVCRFLIDGDQNEEEKLRQLPAWDIGNTYLDQGTMKDIMEELRPELESIKILSSQEKVRVFVVYSGSVRNQLFDFRKALLEADGNGVIDFWSDQELVSGDLIDETIKPRLKISDFIVCLISPDFFDNDYIVNKEWPLIVDRVCEEIERKENSNAICQNINVKFVIVKDEMNNVIDREKTDQRLREFLKQSKVMLYPTQSSNPSEPFCAIEQQSDWKSLVSGLINEANILIRSKSSQSGG